MLFLHTFFKFTLFQVSKIRSQGDAIKKLIDIRLYQNTSHVEDYSRKLQEKQEELRKACQDINKFLKSSDVSLIKRWQVHPQENDVQPISLLFQETFETVGKA